jgi:hypothetical protein
MKDGKENIGGREEPELFNAQDRCRPSTKSSQNTTPRRVFRKYTESWRLNETIIADRVDQPARKDFIGVGDGYRTL